MRLMTRILKILLGTLAVGLVGVVGWVAVSPPELLKVGSGYAAKMVCSNVFLAGRDPDEVLSVDVQAPGNPLLRLMRVSVDREAGRVDAALAGFIAPNSAVYREGIGCAVTPDGAVPSAVTLARPFAPPLDQAALWPDGGRVETDPKVMAVLGNAELTGPGMRAVVVVRGGRIVGETYAPGFDKDMPLLGWSMTKTVTAAIIGTLVRDGKITLQDRQLFPQWKNDQRGEISVASLLGMESGLVFNENYGTVADVTRMLYLERDMAEFAADQPLEADPGSRFSYSSGTSVLLSRIWMGKLGDAAVAHAYPHAALFSPLGMTSAVLEADEAGTFAGSSYMYATGRDWARFGLFLARDGVWRGNRILPEGFVAQMQEPNRSSSGRYSKMHTWLAGGVAGGPGGATDGIPPGTFSMNGHDGQRVIVVPSLDLVVVRLGLTPSWARYRPTDLVAAIAKTATAP